MPYVASASLQRSLTARKNPYFFRVSRLDGLVRPLCQFTAQAMKAKRVAILHTATPGSAEFAARVKSCLEKAGVAVPLLEKFRPGCPDFSVFLLKIRQAKVDVLISGGFYADNLILVRQMQEGPLGLRAFVAPWGGLPELHSRDGPGRRRAFRHLRLESGDHFTRHRKGVPNFRGGLPAALR